MQLLTTSAAPELVKSHSSYIELNDLSINDAKEKFLELKEAGVIKPVSKFEDNAWYTTDEYSNIGLHFRISKFGYKNYEPIFKMNHKRFVDSLKAFMISLFGRNALDSIRTFLLDIRHIIETPPENVYGTMTELTISMPNICSDFFTSLKDADDEQITLLSDAMDSYADLNMASQKASLRQRQLADFETYFKFDDIISDFWNTETDKDTRLFYFPLYLWWKLTAVIPLRPREFLLTKRNCLTRINSTSKAPKKEPYHYTLTLRRNQLKGGRKNVTYRISDDYFETHYPVPDYIGEMINEYIKATDKFKGTKLDTLFVTTPHYKKWDMTIPSDSRFLTYANMSTILRCFYEEIIEEKYGYTVTNDHSNGHLGEKEISFIHLGDTRHIALINLMVEGGTPAVAMMLAGHTNQIMASTYYSNTDELIKCKVYRTYHAMIASDSSYSLQLDSCNLPADDDYFALPDNSRCYSKKFMKGDYSDCRNCVGEFGEIGYCTTCIYHRANNISYFEDDDIYKHKLKDDYEGLCKIVELVRKDRGAPEEIEQALLKLQATSLSYQQFLMEKKLKEERNKS